ncbi:hypothetical protein ACP4OV_009381 [Aristida adscensionis]
MGGCFSSGSGGDEAGYGGYGGAAAAERPPQRMRVWPSDEDGRWPYVGERDVDKKATVFIENFHRHQYGACAACAADQQQPPATPAAAAAAS